MPNPTTSTNGTPRRPIADALTLANNEAEEDNEEGPARGRRKRTRQMNGRRADCERRCRRERGREL